MQRRTRVRSRRRSPRSRGGPRDPRSVAREVREVRKAQGETGKELRDARVPIVTEPAFVFTP